MFFDFSTVTGTLKTRFTSCLSPHLSVFTIQSAVITMLKNVNVIVVGVPCKFLFIFDFVRVQYLSGLVAFFVSLNASVVFVS